MNAFALVRHLFVNDVRRARWMLLAYAASVVLASVSAVSVSSQSGAWLQVVPLLVILMGFGVVASAIQGDSPFRPDAFWASRPISPAAMVGAKLTLAAVLVAVPLLGLTWCLARLGVPGDAYAGTLGRAALSYSTWLLVGMAIAAVTRDLRSFSNTLVLMAVLFMVSSLTLYARLKSSQATPGVGYGLHAALLYLGPLALLVFVYWKRDSVRLARMVGGVMLVAWFLLKPFSLVASAPGATALAANDSVDAPALTVVFDGTRSSSSSTGIEFHVTGASWRNATRLLVTVDSLLVHARDGSTVQLKNRIQRFALSVPGAASDSMPWRDLAPMSPFSVGVLDGERAALASGVESIEIVGHVEAYAAHALPVMPFESGRSASHNGTLIQLDSVQLDSGGVAAVVNTLSVQPDRAYDAARGNLEMDLPRFVLLGDSAHRATRFMVRSAGTFSGWLVLPGTSIVRGWNHLEVGEQGRASNPGITSPARFMYLQWSSVGSARVRARSAGK